VKPDTLLIVGPPRSGTTLLAYLLGGAEGVLCLSEPFLTYAIMPHWKLKRIYARFQRRNALRRTPPPPAGDSARYAVFLQYLARANGFRHLAIKETFRDERLGPRWGNLRLLDELAPRGSRVVALIRHPYDAAASTVRLCRWLVGVPGWLLRWRWPTLPRFDSYMAIVQWAAGNWVRYCRWAQQRELHLLRYEELVSAPEPHLRAACAQLGLRFDPRMLDYRQPRVAFGGIGDPGVIARTPRPVSTRSVGQAHQLTGEQRALVKATCAEAAARYGYAL
jgi:hypothetical protein